MTSTIATAPQFPIPSSSAAPQRSGPLARLARFAVRHRRAVVVSWLVVFVAGIGIGSQVFSRLKDSNPSGSESAYGAKLLKDADSMGMSAAVLVDGPPVDSPRTRTAVEALTDKLAHLPNVAMAVNAYTSDDPALRSQDGHASLVIVSVRKGLDMMDQTMTADAIRHAVHDAVPGVQVKVGGDLGVMRDGMTSSQRDLMHGEIIALPILLIALVFIFGGLRAALLPIVGALVTSAGALTLLLGMTHVTDVASYAVDVILLFGLGLAVDYSLLMVNRFREARAAGADVATAVEHTLVSAGRTVVFSALTVGASLAGLFAFNDPAFTSVALGGIATVLVALAAALSVIPALLATIGAKIRPERERSAENGAFGRIARRVQRRPLVATLALAGILAAAAIPFLHVNFGLGDPRTLPADSEGRQVAATMSNSFPSLRANPVQVVMPLPASDVRVASYAAELAHHPGVASVAIERGLHGNLSAINVVPTGSSQGATAQQLVHDLRANRPGSHTWVTGSAALLIDFKDRITSRLPWALGLIALATFVLLFLMTGSMAIPLKALLMNTLSLGAVFGALVWIFQDGHLATLLGFQSFGAIELWVPVIVFVFAFGLSMDYEVFLLSRIKEAYDESGDTNHAVATGLQRSGRIITSAALAVVVVFLGFAAGHSLGIKEFGLALAVAVIVDATLVRCILVPATMTLLGRANWWAPKPLQRVHERFGLHETPTREHVAQPTLEATPHEVVAVG
ncbi:MAG TPA: MMPL family transporter [Jatrophihabitantaceae bacterium]|jgi:RND superfamily putative drug exporter